MIPVPSEKAIFEGWFVPGRKDDPPTRDALSVHSDVTQAPLSYAGIRGEIRRLPEEMGEKWQSPRLVYVAWGSSHFVEVPEHVYNRGEWEWMHLGWAPAKRTKYGMMRTRFLHGLEMNYPFWSVVAFVLRHRKMF